MLRKIILFSKLLYWLEYNQKQNIKNPNLHILQNAKKNHFALMRALSIAYYKKSQ